MIQKFPLKIISKQIKITYVTSKLNLNRKLKRPAFKALNKYTLKLYQLSLLKSSSLGTEQDLLNLKHCHSGSNSHEHTLLYRRGMYRVYSISPLNSPPFFFFSVFVAPSDADGVLDPPMTLKAPAN